MKLQSKKNIVSYKNQEKFPDTDEVNELKVYVDRKNNTVVLPLFGVPVPFHISMIKVRACASSLSNFQNVSQSVESDFVYLRVNFAHPGSQFASKESLAFPYPLATYIKELTFRASNVPVFFHEVGISFLLRFTENRTRQASTS